MHLLYELKQDLILLKTSVGPALLLEKPTKRVEHEDDNALVLNAQKLLDMPFGKLAANGFRSGR